MSRIDQALRTWEEDGSKSTPSAEVPTYLPGDPSTLRRYPSEEPNRPPRREPPASALPAADRVEPDEPVEPARPAKRVSRRDDPDMHARLVTGAPSSVSVEQYRRLAAVLHEEQAHSQLKTVMITSALPNEGKTLTIANLAMTLSESYGRRVLVVDADLRAPALHRPLNIRNHRGLSEALQNGATDLPIIEVSPLLSALTAGRPGKTHLADLTSERMAEVIRECAAKFDWVLFDTPPVGLLPDAQVLARLVGAVIFVIAAGSTPAAAVERAISEIGPDAIIGTVLNRVEDRRIPEADYYDAYYGEGE